MAAADGPLERSLQNFISIYPTNQGINEKF